MVDVVDRFVARAVDLLDHTESADEQKSGNRLGVILRSVALLSNN